VGNEPSPGTLIEETDPIALDAMLKSLRLEQNSRRYIPDPTLSEEQNAHKRHDYDKRTAELIKLQIGILSKQRKTGTTGPAKAGGKRAKKAPVDLLALERKLGLAR
jgi:hypothetical protein